MDNTIYNKTHITVLKGEKPYLKQYQIVDGKVDKGEVKTAYKHDYVTHDIHNIDELYNIIQQTSTSDNSFIIRGRTSYKQDWDQVRTIKDDLTPEGTFEEHPTAWLCIDFDKKEVPNLNRNSLEAVEWLIQNQLPTEFHNASYIYQWSSSAGLEYNNIPVKIGTNVHLFFYLDKGLVEGELKGWLPKSNGFDVSVFQTIQPIFVNPKCIKDDGIVDVITQDKIGIIHKQEPLVKTPNEFILNQFKEKYSTAASIDVDCADVIIQKLNEVGCIVNKSSRTLSLKSPKEKSQGGFFCMIHDPRYINHGNKPSRRVDVWLMEEWGIEFEMPRVEYNPVNEIISLSERFKNKVADKAPVEDWKAEKEYEECYGRDKRHNLTLKAYYRWMRKSPTVKMLLYAFEGFGKSRIVKILVDDKQKVIFACKTNEQAEEQFVKFQEQGLKAQLILSREYKFKRMGYEHCIATDFNPKHPWDIPSINKTGTVNNLIRTGMKKEEAQLIWEDTTSESIDLAEYDVCIMTHTRLAIDGRIQETSRLRKTNRFNQTFDWEPIIPLNAICIWDDCDRTDFTLLSPYDAQYAGLEIDGKVVETKSYKKVAKNKQEYDVHYFIKPDCFVYGYGIRNRQIFSTTEELTSMLIERSVGPDKLFVPELMPEYKMKAGDITLFKTTMTGRHKDGLLLPLLNRVKKEGYDFYTIGDSISAINHTNNKGQNKYDDKHLVVEISQMNMLDIPMWLDELGWTEEDIGKLKVLDALDRLHQAVGRNSGYRWADKPDHQKKEVVCLVDAALATDIEKHSRYYIDHFEDLGQLDYATYRKRERNSLADCIAWYIQNLESYITEPKIRNAKQPKFVQDCLDVKELNEQKFVDRMITALEHSLVENRNNKVTPKKKAAVNAVLKLIG